MIDIDYEAELGTRVRQRDSKSRVGRVVGQRTASCVSDQKHRLAGVSPNTEYGVNACTASAGSDRSGTIASREPKSRSVCRSLEFNSCLPPAGRASGDGTTHPKFAAWDGRRCAAYAITPCKNRASAPPSRPRFAPDIMRPRANGFARPFSAWGLSSATS